VFLQAERLTQDALEGSGLSVCVADESLAELSSSTNLSSIMKLDQKLIEIDRNTKISKNYHLLIN